MLNRITVDTVTKYYKSTPAIYNVSLTLEKGFVYGLLGPNGAGKSTLCSMLSTSLIPDTGEINFFSRIFSPNTERVLNKDLDEIRKGIGYLPQKPFLFKEMTVAEYLLFVGSSKGLKGNRLYHAVNDVLVATDIESFQNKIIATLSEGSCHRVAISAAILADPDFLIMDEPSNSLDPMQNLLLRNIIFNRKKDNKITLISSHNLYEIENLCDKVIILSEGQVVKTSDLDRLSDKSTIEIHITLSSSVEKSISAVSKINGVISCKNQKNSIVLLAKKDISLEKISTAITSSGGTIIGFSTTVPSLEDMYLKLISK